MSLDAPKESQSLVDVVERDKEYVISEPLSVTHMPGRMQAKELILAVGDVITVKNYDPEKGLLFTCNSIAGQVIISPAEAQKIKVETI